MKKIIFFLFVPFVLCAQDMTFSIDSVGASAWYFTTTNTVTGVGSDQQVQGYRRFFDNKDSVLQYAKRVLYAIQLDSIAAQRSLVQADSSKRRIGRQIYRFDTSFSGSRSVLAPPIPPTKAPTTPAKTKQSAVNTKTRVKKLKSEK